MCVCVYRVKQVLGSLRSQLPVLSDSEKDMRKELHTIHDQLRHLDNGIKQVRSVSVFPYSIYAALRCILVKT